MRACRTSQTDAVIGLRGTGRDGASHGDASLSAFEGLVATPGASSGSYSALFLSGSRRRSTFSTFVPSGLAWRRNVRT